MWNVVPKASLAILSGPRRLPCHSQIGTADATQSLLVIASSGRQCSAAGTKRWLHNGSLSRYAPIIGATRAIGMVNIAHIASQGPGLDVWLRGECRI
jgi:hypothetical protein